MTGFASLVHETDVVVVSVTARTVNHRYLDIQIRAPQVLQAIESNVRDLVQQCLARCLLYTSPSPRDGLLSRMPSSA